MKDNGKVDLWSADEIKKRYGSFYHASPRLDLDKHKVPEEYWPLLPYAEFWGLSDDSDREDLINQAPHDIRKNLKEVVAAFDVVLDEWLAGPEADNPKPTLEYVAFSAMRMVSYLA